MYYKPNDTASDAPNMHSGNDQMPSEMTHTADEQHDSGLDSMNFPSTASVEMTSVTSLTLDSIRETVEVDGSMQNGEMDNINGNFSRMSLRERGACNTGLDKNFSDKLEQCDIDPDSGVFTSISSTTGSDRSIDHVASITSGPSSNQEWISVIEHRCSGPGVGQFDMEKVVRLFHGNHDGDNWLNLFIIHERPEVALFLISLAPDHDWLNLYNNLRQTPLHLAVMTRQSTIVRRLICAGASVFKQDLSGNTPLHLACAMGCEDIVRLLLDPVRCSETAQNCYRIPFQSVSQVGGLRNFEGNTCLHLAAIAGNVNIVQCLLEHGFDPNVGDGKSGRTVLHHAAETGHMEMTKLLLAQRGAQCDIEDYGRHTPHDLARGQQKSQVMRLLISHGAKPSLSWGRRSSDSDDDDDDNDCMMTNGHCSG